MAIQYKYNLPRQIVDRIIRWQLTRDRAPEHYYLLTVTGRKSGLPRSRPVALVEDGEQRWLVAPYGAVNWVYNARAAGKVTLSRGDFSEEFSITELPVEERAPILKEYVTLYTITRPYFDAAFDSPVEAFIKEAKTRPVFKLEKLTEE